MFVEFDPTEVLVETLSPTMSPVAVERFVGRVEPTIGFSRRFDDGLGALTTLRVPSMPVEPVASLSPVWPVWGSEPLALACAVDLSLVPEVPQWRSRPAAGWLCLFVPAIDGGAGEHLWSRVEQHGEFGFNIGPGGYAAFRIVDELGFELGVEGATIPGLPEVRQRCGLRMGWSVHTNGETLSDEEYTLVEDEAVREALRSDAVLLDGQLFGCFDYLYDVFAAGGHGRRSFFGISTGDYTYATYIDAVALEANDFSSFSYTENPV